MMARLVWGPFRRRNVTVPDVEGFHISVQNRIRPISKLTVHVIVKVVPGYVPYDGLMMGFCPLVASTAARNTLNIKAKRGANVRQRPKSIMTG